MNLWNPNRTRTGTCLTAHWTSTFFDGLMRMIWYTDMRCFFWVYVIMWKVRCIIWCLCSPCTHICVYSRSVVLHSPACISVAYRMLWGRWSGARWFLLVKDQEMWRRKRRCNQDILDGLLKQPILRPCLAISWSDVYFWRVEKAL